MDSNRWEHRFTCTDGIQSAGSGGRDSGQLSPPALLRPPSVPKESRVGSQISTGGKSSRAYQELSDDLNQQFSNERESTRTHIEKIVAGFLIVIEFYKQNNYFRSGVYHLATTLPVPVFLSLIYGRKNIHGPYKLRRRRL